MSTELNRKRSHQERIEAIFAFIEKQAKTFPKSQFKEIGLNPRTAEMWLKLIEYIQNQPRIRLIQTDHNLFVEKVEGKYQALMRNLSVDDTVPFEQRLQFLTDYLKSLYTREKTRDQSKTASSPETNQNSSQNSTETIRQILDALSTCAILDSKFNQYAQILRSANPNSEEVQFYALSKWQKEVLMNIEFQNDLKRILNREFYFPSLDRIIKEYPDFMEQLKRAKQIFQTYYSFLHQKFADWMFKLD